MGYGTHRFVATPDQNLLCGICSGVVEDAVLTRCGHSFCEACLDTWLARPNTGNCPVCRALVVKYQVSPVWSLRAIVGSLSVECKNRDRGCQMIVKLETLSSHLESCGYTPVDCIGCGATLNGFQLAAHQIKCPKIRSLGSSSSAVTTGTNVTTQGDDKTSAGVRLSEYKEMFSKVASLEAQLKAMKRDLDSTKSKNSKLERELCKVRLDLEAKRDECEVLRAQNHDLYSEYDYGYTPESIAQLSLFIARNLLDKPEYVERDHIFNCIKRSYENFARCGNEYEHDVHMLIATAYASDWFSENQRINCHCWLQSIARYRKYADLHHARVSSRCSPT